jgi:Leucine-rich repeat (LRR) protein
MKKLLPFKKITNIKKSSNNHFCSTPLEGLGEVKPTTMKNILLLVTTLYSIFTFANANDPIITIPDANFKAKLLAASPSNTIASNGISNVKIDTNNDGEIQVSEALLIKGLFFNAENMASLSGIEAFSNLLFLSCNGNSSGNNNNLLTSLNVSNLTNLEYLYCNDNKLNNLNITGLVNLKRLECGQNYLTTLNLTGLINLEQLQCSFNQITSLNFAGLTNLKSISCSSNPLNNLDVSSIINLQSLSCTYILCNINITGLSNLVVFDCGFNNLTSLNLSGLTNLQELDCYGNQLTTLNLTGLTNLRVLRCGSNLFNTLSFPNLINLEDLDCTYSHQLINLDVSNLIKLKKLNCNYNNQLSVLNIKNGKIEENLFFSNNPNLKNICCDENQLLSVQQKVTQYGYTNCHVNTYCSFPPGGNYNIISGQIKYDFDNNGCDANDLPVIYAKITSPSFTGSNTIYANNQGQYNAYVLQGTHTITPQIENPSLFVSTPPTAQITFANSNNNTQTQNFCFTPNPNNITCSYESVIMPISPVRPGFDTDFKIIYRNLGNVVLTGEVVLPYNANTMTFISATPAPTTISNGLLKWSFNQMMPLQNRHITLKFNINPPTHPTFPVNGGDLVCFEPYMSITNNCSSINQPEFDETCFEVVNAYDPNDKTCLQGNTPSPQYIGKYVHYKIRFENTGTYFAQNVVVRDDIDLSKFDINSLVVLDASHNMLVTRIKDNRVEFIFENIQLPFPPSEARHGYILFKIKLKSTLVVGNTFSNQANIYFDYNHPIITNNEVSTLTALGTPNFDFSEFITLYPNPANDLININTKQGINLKSIEIYNTLGQLLMAIPNQSNERSIDVSSLQSGTYMIKVNSDKGVSHSKFVKE